MQALARRVTGQEDGLTTSWGSTETAPAVTSAHWRLERAGVIGLPMPGTELTSGDWKGPQHTETASKTSLRGAPFS
ncbi:MAG TPA: hypothetical protein PKY30_23740 [Myxococcota bacterium]|nr:hypothetical protein [Myxococcota bacterium]